MTRNAVLLMDLQHDFLGAEGSRMPVESAGAAAVVCTANAVLNKEVLSHSLPILVVNQFPVTDRLGNFFRRGAAVVGTRGASLDARILCYEDVKVIAKEKPSAFSNPELDTFLRTNGITDLYVIGVFAEGCVRSTVLDARRRGYGVHVVADAVASNASWKKRFALWAMKRAGADIIPSVRVQTAS